MGIEPLWDPDGDPGLPWVVADAWPPTYANAYKAAPCFRSGDYETARRVAEARRSGWSWEAIEDAVLRLQIALVSRP
jgi:hypothetical protein